MIATLIQKISNIPEDKWNIQVANEDRKSIIQWVHVRSLFSDEERRFFRNWTFWWQVNDGTHEKYQQPTIKQRVLAALNDKLQSENICHGK